MYRAGEEREEERRRREKRRVKGQGERRRELGEGREAMDQ